MDKPVMGRFDYNSEHPEQFIWSTVDPLPMAEVAVRISKAIENNRYPEQLEGLKAALNIIACMATKGA